MVGRSEKYALDFFFFFAEIHWGMIEADFRRLYNDFLPKKILLIKE